MVLVEAELEVNAFDEASARKKVGKALAPRRLLGDDVATTAYAEALAVTRAARAEAAD